MGARSAKSHVVIDVCYCGGCGWTKTAQQLCQAIKKQLPQSTIDCRPEEKFTGVLEVSVIINKTNKQAVFKGNKQKTIESINQITKDVINMYEKA